MRNPTSRLTGAKGNRKRSVVDFYPTPPEVTHALLDYIPMRDIQAIWEPACGDYDMVNVLKERGHKVVATDLRYGDNYLSCDVPVALAGKSFAVITNPPFNEAEAFIRRAVGESTLVFMLLKHNYFSAKTRLPLARKYPPNYVLPLTWRPNFYFKEGKGSPTMDVCWYGWDRLKGEEQIFRPLEKPIIDVAQ